MATIKITYPRAKWEHAPEAAREVIRAGLTEITSGVSAWIYERAPQDTSTSKNSIGSDVQERGAGSFRGSSFASARYAPFALETGRGPGGFPPPPEILGWVQRRGFSAAQIGKVQGVGARVGGGFRQGQQIGLARKHISVSTRQFGQADAAQRRIAFLVGRKIAQKGTKALRLFTRAVRETRQSIQVPAIKRMAEAIARIL